MEHARMIAAQRQAKDDEIVRLRERCRILELSKAEYDDFLDVKDNELAAQDDEIERLQRENEEVMRQKAYQYQRAKKAEEELAALKAQSTLASVWLWRNKTTFCFFATKELAMQMNSGGLSTWVEPVEVPVIGNTTPPTAAALVEDFRKRAVEGKNDEV